MIAALQMGSSAAPSYALGTWLFLRLLGLIYLAAFSSLAAQVRGLVGRQGILPMVEFLAARRRLGARRFVLAPTLCWLKASDGFLLFLCWGGAGLAFLLALDVAPL